MIDPFDHWHSAVINSSGHQGKWDFARQLCGQKRKALKEINWVNYQSGGGVSGVFGPSFAEHFFWILLMIYWCDLCLYFHPNIIQNRAGGEGGMFTRIESALHLLRGRWTRSVGMDGRQLQAS